MDTELTPYLNALTQHVSCNKEIIKTLKFLRLQAEDVRENSRVMQTVGTTFGAMSTLSTVSALGTLLAPVTAGLSVVLPAVAFGAALGGVSAKVVGGINDHFDTKDLQEKIKEQQKKHVRSVERLNKEQKKIRQILETLENKGYSATVAMVSTIVCLGSNVIKFTKGTKDAIDAANVIEMAIESQRVTKLLAGTGLQVTTHVTGTGYSVIFTSAEAAANFSPSQVAAAGQLWHNPQLFGNSYMDALNVLAVVGVAFTLFDFTMLIANWDKPHELDGFIQQFIKNLEGDCKRHRNTVSMIKTLTNL